MLPTATESHLCAFPRKVTHLFAGEPRSKICVLDLPRPSIWLTICLVDRISDTLSHWPFTQIDDFWWNRQSTIYVGAKFGCNTSSKCDVLWLVDGYSSMQADQVQLRGWKVVTQRLTQALMLYCFVRAGVWPKLLWKVLFMQEFI